MQRDAMRCNAMRCDATQCDAMQREARRRDRYSDLYSAVQGRTPIGKPERAKADADVRPLRKGRRAPPLRLRPKWDRIGRSGIESA
jgi:hypothetical protein